MARLSLNGVPPRPVEMQTAGEFGLALAAAAFTLDVTAVVPEAERQQIARVKAEFLIAWQNSGLAREFDVVFPFETDLTRRAAVQLTHKELPFTVTLYVPAVSQVDYFSIDNDQRGNGEGYDLYIYTRPLLRIPNCAGPALDEIQLKLANLN